MVTTIPPHIQPKVSPSLLLIIFILIHQSSTASSFTTAFINHATTANPIKTISTFKESLTSSSSSYLQNQLFQKPSPSSPSKVNLSKLFMAIESLTLNDDDDNDESYTIFSEKMSRSVAAWLDNEWMPQSIHQSIGQSVATSYIKCRRSGDRDVMSIMTTVVDDLEQRWSEYDADAFVNAWDVGNYVSDYLARMGAGVEEGSCECSAKIVEVD